MCILSFALNRVCVKVRVSNPQWLPYTQILVEYSSPPPTTQEFHRVLFLPLLALYVPSVILRKGAQIVSAKIEMHKYPAAT